VALGAALAYPYYGYPYSHRYSYPYSYPYLSSYPYPVYGAPVVPSSPPIQREVVHPTGRHVLHGDGITQPWQWVWVPAPPPVPPSP
jgi:hypothetical protein